MNKEFYKKIGFSSLVLEEATGVEAVRNSVSEISSKIEKIDTVDISDEVLKNFIENDYMFDEDDYSEELGAPIYDPIATNEVIGNYLVTIFPDAQSSEFIEQTRVKIKCFDDNENDEAFSFFIWSDPGFYYEAELVFSGRVSFCDSANECVSLINYDEENNVSKLKYSSFLNNLDLVRLSIKTIPNETFQEETFASVSASRCDDPSSVSGFYFKNLNISGILSGAGAVLLGRTGPFSPETFGQCWELKTSPFLMNQINLKENSFIESSGAVYFFKDCLACDHARQYSGLSPVGGLKIYPIITDVDHGSQLTGELQIVEQISDLPAVLTQSGNQTIQQPFSIVTGAGTFLKYNMNIEEVNFDLFFIKKKDECYGAGTNQFAIVSSAPNLSPSGDFLNYNFNIACLPSALSGVVSVPLDYSAYNEQFDQFVQNQAQIFVDYSVVVEEP